MFLDQEQLVVHRKMNLEVCFNLIGVVEMILVFQMARQENSHLMEIQ